MSAGITARLIVTNERTGETLVDVTVDGITLLPRSWDSYQKRMRERHFISLHGRHIATGSQVTIDRLTDATIEERMDAEQREDAERKRVAAIWAAGND